MILDLREFERFPARVTVTANPEKFSINYDGVLGVKTVVVDLTVQHVGDDYYCQGQAKAALVLECARCLGRFETDVENDMDFLCRSDEPAETDDERAVDDEDYAFFTGLDLRVDISELVRQALVLAIDIKPICGDECRGLCGSCGVNLNEKDCDCHQEKIDPRWDALKKLKNDD